MKTQNIWFDSLVLALKANQAHKSALAALIRYHGGRRSEPLMNDLCNAVHALHKGKGCRARVTCRAGQFNVSFPGKGVGFDMWRTMILPHLPLMRAGTASKRKSKSVDPQERLVSIIKRLHKGGATWSQIERALQKARA